MAENKYQRGLIRRLKHNYFPGSMVLKNDPNYIQGIPDLTLLDGPCWATLEVKDSDTASLQPNQAFYVKQMNDMSFSAIIYPEIEKEVILALQEAFASRRSACVS